jgi:hypothetical protein
LVGVGLVGVGFWEGFGVVFSRQKRLCECKKIKNYFYYSSLLC